MKLAIISDIHDNLPALDTVMENIRNQDVDGIYCFGDLVNFAGWDNEVIDLIRSHNIPCVQGNHDEGIGWKKESFPFSFSNKAKEEFGLASIKRVNETIMQPNRKFLQNLPSTIKFEFHVANQCIKIAFVHANPSNNIDCIEPKTSYADLKTLLKKAGTDVLVMGHTHKPFHRILTYENKENKKVYKHAVNVGSVGKPKHSDNRACYVTIEVDESTTLDNPKSFRVYFYYINYDVEKVSRKIKKMGLSNAYNEFLKKGYGYEKDI